MVGMVLFKKLRREIVRYLWLMVGVRKKSRLLSFMAGFNQHLNPYTHVAAVVVIRPPADKVAVHYARLVHEYPAAHFEVEFALWYSRHLPALNASGVSRYFHAVTNAGDGLVGLEEMPCNPHEVFVVSNVLRRPAAGEKYAEIFLRLNILKSNVRLQRIALEFPRNLPVPVRRNLVQHHVVSPLFRPRHDRLKTVFLQAIIRIKRIDRFSGITNYNKYLIHFASNIKLLHEIVNSETAGKHLTAHI